jgi:integrase
MTILMESETKVSNALQPVQNEQALTTIQPLDQHPAAVFLTSLPSAHSRRNMRRYLNQVAALLTNVEGVDALEVNWAALRYVHVAAIRSQLMSQYAPATVNAMLSAVRGVLKQAWKLGQMSAEEYQRAIDVPNVKGETLPTGRDLSDGEILALVQACQRDETPAGVRDAALIGVLATCGLRRAEVAALTSTDFDPLTGRLTVQSGKGRKARIVYAAGGALAALTEWLVIRGGDPGALFVPINKGGNLQQGRGISAQAIYFMLEKRANEAGVENFTPHDFRRTFVGELLDRGVDMVTVSKLAGHADPKTTARYDRRPEETKRQAAAKLHYPYQRRKR